MGVHDLVKMDDSYMDGDGRGRRIGCRDNHGGSGQNNIRAGGGAHGCRSVHWTNSCLDDNCRIDGDLDHGHHTQGAYKVYQHRENRRGAVLSLGCVRAQQTTSCRVRDGRLRFLRENHDVYAGRSSCREMAPSGLLWSCCFYACLSCPTVMSLHPHRVHGHPLRPRTPLDSTHVQKSALCPWPTPGDSGWMWDR